MKGTNLGELEEIVLLVVANLHENAFALIIKTEIEEKCNRSITISTVHNVLQRLVEKGFLESSYSDPTPERGGKRKLLFNLTAGGKQALQSSKDLRDKLWSGIPNFSVE